MSILRKITLTQKGPNSGPVYTFEESSNCINYTTGAFESTVFLENVGDEALVTVNDNTACIRLTSLNNICSSSIVQQIGTPAPPPISGAYELRFNIDNRTTESIDSASIQFNFVDQPNVRQSGSFIGEWFYITASNVPIGKSTYTTKMNFTGSLPSGRSMSILADPDLGSTVVRYAFSASLNKDGVRLTSSSLQTDAWSNGISATFYFNPVTWATMSYDLTASYTQSVNKNMIIESYNNTTWYAGTASTDDIFINRFDTYNFKQDTYPSGFLTTSGTRVITGSANLDTFIGWPVGYGRLSVTQSLFGDNVLITTANAIYDTRVSSGVTMGPGNINYDNYQTIKSVTTINDAPLTGSRVLEYRVKNNTSQSIDRLWWAFDFSDTPNYRKPTDGDGILTGYRYYVSASNVPVGDSVYRTIVNFTSSLVQPPQDYNLYCDPDDASSVLRYNFNGIIRQDGVQQGTFTALTASVFNQFPNVSLLNPMTWATCSFELTASLTQSAPPAPTACYTLETVQSSQGECFDCPGNFASTTDTVMKIFTTCSGSEIFPPFDINVESRYSDNSTSSLLIPSGSTGSLIIATSDVQCAPLPACGEIASPTFLSASITSTTGSITQCCV